MSNNPTRYIKSIAHQPVDPGIHGQIVDSMSATTDKRGNAPSIRMAMSNGLPAGAIVEYTGNEVPDGYRRRDDIPTLSELNDNLTDGIGGTTDKFRFGTDGNGNYGYIKDVGGADTFFPFKVTESFNTEYQLGTEHELMISADTFIYVPVMGYSKIGLNRRSTNISVSYKFKYSDGTYSTPTTITLSVNVPIEFTVPNNAIAFMLKFNGTGQAVISYGMKS